MKLFLIGWSGKDFGLAEVARRLQNSGHKIIYWTCSDKEINPVDFPDTIFHKHLDALEGHPAPALLNEKFNPPGEKLLHNLSETESTIITMMNKHFENWQVEERKHFYRHYVGYWHYILTKFKPDAIIYPTIPHTVYDFVIYSLAKLLNIKNVMFEQIWIGDRMIWAYDFQTGFPLLKDKISKNKNENFNSKNLDDDFRKEYELQNEPGKDATPAFVKYFKSRFSGKNLIFLKLKIILTSIKDGSFLRRAAVFINKFFGENLVKEYRSVQVYPDFSKKFVYFPLHYQPERTSSPQGGVFADQLLVVETLSAALPDGWLIYVKEHPNQWGPRGINYFSYRFPGYYKKMAALKNVRIVPVNLDSYFLMEKSQAVATITGTAGWEAAARRKPALIFGYAWYRDCPGVFRIIDVDSCRAALNKIKNGFSVTTKEVINYLKSLEQASFHGYMEECGKGTSELTLNQNATNIFAVLTGVLENKNNL